MVRVQLQLVGGNNFARIYLSFRDVNLAAGKLANWEQTWSAQQGLDITWDAVKSLIKPASYNHDMNLLGLCICTNQKFHFYFIKSNCRLQVLCCEEKL